MDHQSFDLLRRIVSICWIAFLLYWAISAFGAKQNVPGKGGFGRWARARLLLILIVYLLYTLPVFRPFWRFAYGLPFFYSDGARIAGVVLTVLGLGFAIWARVHLGRNWSGQPSMKVGHELITSGPYNIVRHPIYTGLLVALLGAGLVYGPLWMVALLFVIVMFLWRIHREEGYMMELFPDVYPAYQERTKALIPGVW
ncbi:methyltransferase family protein [Acidicapsa dinghuensis]|uniref:Methyltransferase family protein n=1 Tax=Acidicapsa dinghuensis TaxID=2218256 RepID=A0ABW1EA41_9BACT|nr:isoprenylcysteine carboxylmethyltransferase family protein [Acidicapsa dinghuensis]